MSLYHLAILARIIFHKLEESTVSGQNLEIDSKFPGYSNGKTAAITARRYVCPGTLKNRTSFSKGPRVPFTIPSDMECPHYAPFGFHAQTQPPDFGATGFTFRRSSWAMATLQLFPRYGETNIAHDTGARVAKPLKTTRVSVSHHTAQEHNHGALLRSDAASSRRKIRISQNQIAYYPCNLGG